MAMTCCHLNIGSLSPAVARPGTRATLGKIHNQSDIDPATDPFHYLIYPIAVYGLFVSVR